MSNGFTHGKVDRHQEQIEENIQLAEVEAKTERLREKIVTLREQIRRIDTIREELKQPAGSQSLADRLGLALDDLSGHGHWYGRS